MQITAIKRARVSPASNRSIFHSCGRELMRDVAQYREKIVLLTAHVLRVEESLRIVRLERDGLRKQLAAATAQYDSLALCSTHRDQVTGGCVVCHAKGVPDGIQARQAAHLTAIQAALIARRTP